MERRRRRFAGGLHRDDARVKVHIRSKQFLTLKAMANDRSVSSAPKTSSAVTGVTAVTIVLIQQSHLQLS
jgi:hypothetical protein